MHAGALGNDPNDAILTIQITRESPKRKSPKIDFCWPMWLIGE